MKLTQLQSHLRRENISAALFHSLREEPDPNFFYLTQYSGMGGLVVPKTGRPTLLVPKMEYEKAKAESPLKAKTLKERLFPEMLKLAGKGKSIALDYTATTLAIKKAISKAAKNRIFKDISPTCENLRKTKTKKELTYIRKACRETDGILQKAFNTFKDFDTETDVAAFLQYETARRGLQLAFPPIVASGKHGSMPHYSPKNTKLLPGLCVIDFGVKYKGYCSDMTRTIGIKNVPKQQKDAYEKLWMTQEAILAQAEPDTPCKDLYEATRAALGKDARHFIHSLGHGLGVEIHESPNIGPKSKDNLQKNMPFTIEPGIYYPGKFGIRIEDTAVITNRKEVLTRTTKDLLIV